MFGKKFEPDYSEGLAVAIANTEEEAMMLVEKDYQARFGITRVITWGPVEIFDIDTPIAVCVGDGA